MCESPGGRAACRVRATRSPRSVYLTQTACSFPALLKTLERAALGYALALVIGTVIGLAVVRVPVLRAGVGSLLAGLQSLPSVVWVPFAVLFLSSAVRSSTRCTSW